MAKRINFLNNSDPLRHVLSTAYECRFLLQNVHREIKIPPNCLMPLGSISQKYVNQANASLTTLQKFSPLAKLKLIAESQLFSSEIIYPSLKKQDSIGTHNIPAVPMRLMVGVIESFNAKYLDVTAYLNKEKAILNKQ